MTPGAPADPPTPAPDSLASPIELDIASVEVGTLAISSLGETPLQAVARPHSPGAEGGAQHRVDGLSLAWGRLRGEGSAEIGTAAPLPVEASLALTQDGALANAAVVGARRADGRARAAAPAGHAARRAGQRPRRTAAAGADTRSAATLRPFERWPLAICRRSERPGSPPSTATRPPPRSAAKPSPRPTLPTSPAT